MTSGYVRAQFTHAGAIEAKDRVCSRTVVNGQGGLDGSAPLTGRSQAGLSSGGRFQDSAAPGLSTMCGILTILMTFRATQRRTLVVGVSPSGVRRLHGYRPRDVGCYRGCRCPPGGLCFIPSLSRLGATPARQPIAVTRAFRPRNSAIRAAVAHVVFPVKGVCSSAFRAAAQRRDDPGKKKPGLSVSQTRALELSWTIAATLSTITTGKALDGLTHTQRKERGRLRVEGV